MEFKKIIEFYEDEKNVKAVYYTRNGRAEGPAIFYYRNRNVQSKGTYKNGRFVGIYEQYHENGHLRSKHTYNEDGFLDGLATFYDESGNLYERTIFRERLRSDGALMYSYRVLWRSEEPVKVLPKRNNGILQRNIKGRGSRAN